jgi:tetratricopeptide (TPR) repeat protein
MHGVRNIPLSGLSGDDAVALLQELGVTGDATLMRTFLSEFGDHALLIQVLAGRIRAYKPDPGNFDAWYQVVGRRLELRDHMLVSRQASILQAALEDLDPALFRLLSQLAAFRYPVDYDTVVAINPFRAPNEDRDVGLEPLHQGLTTLEERGLVQWDRKHNRYDLHPVVRAYAYGKLEDKEATYAQVKSYFEALPPEDTRQAQDVADLRQTLELYHALLNGGQVDDAFLLYRDRLSDLLLYNLGGYATIVELLSPLFPQGFDEPPAMPTTRGQSYIAKNLAKAFGNLGDHAQAQRVYVVSYRVDLVTWDAANLANGLDVLEQSMYDAGQLAMAGRKGTKSGRPRVPRPCQHLFSDWRMDTGRVCLCRLAGQPRGVHQSIATRLYPCRRTSLGQGQDPDPLLARALHIAQENRFLYPERMAQRLIGEVAFTQRDLVHAHEAWQAAHNIAQREGYLSAPIWLTWRVCTQPSRMASGPGRCSASQRRPTAHR